MNFFHEDLLFGLLNEFNVIRMMTLENFGQYTPLHQSNCRCHNSISHVKTWLMQTNSPIPFEFEAFPPVTWVKNFFFR